MATLTRPSRHSAFSVFRNRSFTLLWIAQFISRMGSGITAIAASILVYRMTGSALSVGLILMATALPSLLVGLIAGVFVDRYDRKQIMVVADLIRALLVGMLPFLLPFGVAWLYIIVLLSSTLAQFFDPALDSVLPETAADEELAAANSLMTISFTAAEVIGFTVAGLIAAQLPIEWAFYLDALSFALSAAFIAGVRLAPMASEEQTTAASVLHNLRAGIRFVRDTPALRSLFLVFVPVFALFGFQNSLLLPFATRALHANEFQYGLIEGLTAVGFVLGATLMAGLADRLHEGQWIATSILGIGVASVVYSQLASVPLAIAVGAFSAFMNAPSYIGRSLLIQRNTPREVRGRVNSAFFVTRNVLFVLGMAAAGLADLFGVRPLFLTSALLLVGAGAFALVLPGLGQPTAEWRRMLTMLRSAPSAAGLGLGRPATVADLGILASHLPLLGGLGNRDRRALASQMRVHEVPSGTAIVRHGDFSKDAFFILDGRAVAGRAAEDGAQRALEVLNAGDFFGEIAALTGVPRTADVVTEQPTTVLQVPAATLQQIIADPWVRRYILNRMTERLVRLDLIDLPRFPSLDQQTLRELRTPEPQPAPGSQPMPAAG
jgi:MFS transporter, DHA3 family, macrolide efflux protein